MLLVTQCFDLWELNEAFCLTVTYITRIKGHCYTATVEENAHQCHCQQSRFFSTTPTHPCMYKIVHYSVYFIACILLHYGFFLHVFYFYFLLCCFTTTTMNIPRFLQQVPERVIVLWQSCISKMSNFL